MLKDIHIQNYRGIKDLKIGDFKKINLLVGDNNSGKTSVLEAIGLSTNYNISGVIAFEGFRESGRLPQFQVLQDAKLWSDFEYLFHEKLSEAGFRISSTLRGKDSESKEDKIEVKCFLSKEIGMFANSQVAMVIDQALNNSLIAEYTENGKNPAKLGYSRDGTAKEASNLRKLSNVSLISSARVKPSELIVLMKKVVEENREESFSDLARKIDPKIKAVKTAGDQIYANIGAVSVPLKYMGDGLVSVLHILLRIDNLKGGVLLIDEIENGLHWKTQKILWKAIISAAKDNDVQIIATTHSREMASALNEVCEEGLINREQFVVFSLDKDGEKNYVNTYAGEDLEFRLNAGGEIR